MFIFGVSLIVKIWVRLNRSGLFSLDSCSVLASCNPLPFSYLLFEPEVRDGSSLSIGMEQQAEVLEQKDDFVTSL